MRKLYLSSYQLGSEPVALGDLVAPGARAAIIMNATDAYGSAHRPAQVEAHSQRLASLGITSEELDLRDYFGHHDRLARELRRFGVVWAVGGNAFVLRRAMRDSGFDVTAPDLVRAGALVYAGFSAGAIVATPTLAGIEIVDDPDAVPEGYGPEVVWDGLGLYDRSIAPHFRSEHPESALIDQVVRVFESRRMPYQALRDGEAIVIRGDDVGIVGSP